MNNRAFVVGSIFGGIIATIVVGNVLSHNRNTGNETTDSEPIYKSASNSAKKTSPIMKGCDTYVI